MPGFTFEKITPPDERKPIATPAANKRSRSPVVRILERFVELRVRRKLNASTDVGKRHEPPAR
jgi:hypothetical protein